MRALQQPAADHSSCLATPVRHPPGRHSARRQPALLPVATHQPQTAPLLPDGAVLPSPDLVWYSEMRGAAVEGSGPYFIKPGRKVYYAPNELGPNRLQDGHVSLNCKAKVHISSTLLLRPKFIRFDFIVFECPIIPISYSDSDFFISVSNRSKKYENKNDLDIFLTVFIPSLDMET
jgi:hypothetical protein